MAICLDPPDPYDHQRASPPSHPPLALIAKVKIQMLCPSCGINNPSQSTHCHQCSTSLQPSRSDSPTVQPTSPNEPTGPLGLAAGIAGAIGGWALSQYAGASLWLPGIATVVLFLLFTKTLIRPRLYAGAISVISGHMAWLLFAGFYTGKWLEVGPDIFLLAIGVAWLWARPTPYAALYLGVLEAVFLAANLYLWANLEIGSSPHRALAVHVVWRVLAIICLIHGYRMFRKDSAHIEGGV